MLYRTIVFIGFLSLAGMFKADAATPDNMGGCMTDSECQAATDARKNGRDPADAGRLVQNGIHPMDAAVKAQKKTRNAVTIKACGAKWKEAKSDAAVKAAGWPAFWSACAKAAKAEKAGKTASILDFDD